MARSVPPFFTADPTAIAFAGWSMLRDGDWLPVPASLPDWDYNTDLTFTTTVSVDDAALRSSTHLGPDVPLRWCVTYFVTDVRLGRQVSVLAYTPDEPTALEIAMQGTELGPIVDVRTTLTRADTNPNERQGRARLAGSVLWEQRTKVILAGDLARFPILVTDFAASGLDNDASWALEIPEDLSVPVLGGLLLMVNERDVELVNEVTGGRATAQLSPHLYEFVAATLLDAAAARADELGSDEWDEGSVGHSLLLLASRSPGGITELAATRQHRSAEYQARIAGEARRNGMGRRLS